MCDVLTAPIGPLGHNSRFVLSSTSVASGLFLSEGIHIISTATNAVMCVTVCMFYLLLC